MKRLSFPVIASIAPVLLLAGCGAPQEQTYEIPQGMVTVSDDGTTEATVTTEEGTTVNVTTTDEGASMTTSDGATITSGNLVAFPDDTPDALPRFPAMTLHAVTSTENPRTITYQAEVSLPTDSAMSWFKGEVGKHGWKETTAMEQPGLAVAGYEKSDASLNITILAGEPSTGSGTVLNVTYTEK